MIAQTPSDNIDTAPKNLTCSPVLLFGIVLTVLIVGLILIGPLFSSLDPNLYRPELRLQSPHSEAWLGTDRYGRDVFLRLVYGGRVTLLMSMLALSSAVMLGMTLGLLAGYIGGWFDRIVRAFIDILLAFPSTILALVVVGLFGAGLVNILIALVSVWWVGFARIVRSSVLAAKHAVMIDAARVLGAHPRTIIWREIVPQTLGPMLALATIELGHLILSISALSYLGLGAQPPSPEWGAMLADGRAFAEQAPHLLLAPAGAVLLTVLALNCLGEGLRDALEPAGTQQGASL